MIELISRIEDLGQIETVWSGIENTVSIRQDSNDQIQEKNIEQDHCRDGQELTQQSHARWINRVEHLKVVVSKWGIENGQHRYERALKFFQVIDEVHVSDNSKHHKHNDVHDQEVEEILHHLAENLNQRSNLLWVLEHGHNSKD